jgi:hypothetical protein
MLLERAEPLPDLVHGLRHRPSAAAPPKAQSKLSCGQLKKCTLPPLPPPPPPITACLTVCNHLVDVCKLLPSNQRLTCIAGCATLAPTKKQCALDAQKKGQCAQMMICLF